MYSRRSAFAELPDNRAKVETLVKFVISSARAHIAETTEDEWMQEYEIAADAFTKANGDLIREFVSAGMSAGEFPAGDADLVEKMVAAMILEYVVMVNSDPGYDRDAELVERIGEERPSEVILALGADVEGEATSHYLAEMLAPTGVHVTRIAQGLPAGGGVEQADQITLHRALANRGVYGQR